jgi:hypothetical protein
VLVIVTPAPSASVTLPAPICAMFITSPALKTLGGTVKVIGLALLSVTSWLRLPATKVYVVPVSASNSSFNLSTAVPLVTPPDSPESVPVVMPSISPVAPDTTQVRRHKKT